MQVNSARPIRLTVVMTHPVQYYGPWFRYIAAHCPELELSVIYATEPDPQQQGVGFGQAFAWDVGLKEGYCNRVLRPAKPGESVHSSSFRGIDVPEIVHALREDHPDEALIPGWHSITQRRALRACRDLGVPVLYRGDTNLTNAPGGWRNLLWRARTRWLLRKFDAYLSVGRRCREYLETFGAPPERIFDSPHCVDNEFFQASADRSPGERLDARAGFGLKADDFVVLFAGKLEPKKRPADAVRAVAQLAPGAALLVVGSGRLEQEVRGEAQRLGVRLAWAGFLNQSEIGRAYAAADCLALPSTAAETWGLVVNEALAAGTPCVVSDHVGCAPDLVTPGVTGDIFLMGDVAGFAAALQRVREKTAGGHDWRPACRERAGLYSYAQASAGLVKACQAAKEGFARRGKPRVMALFGSMVIIAGVERMSFEVLRVLRERGASIHVVVNSWENHRIVAMADEIGVPHTIGRYYAALRRHIRSPLDLGNMSWDILVTSAALLRDCRRFRPTHIFVPQFNTTLRNYPAIVLLRLLGVKIVMRLGNPPDPQPFYRRFWKYLLHPVTDLFVANSAYTRRELIACGVPAGKTTFIYNTAPTRAVTAAEVCEKDASKVVYVGQIIPPKGVHLLLDAVGLLVQRGRDVRLDVVGEFKGWESPTYAGYRGKLLERAEQPDLRGRVSFLGYREDVPACLATGSVHCCPSMPHQREGFGVVTLEAKLAGLPSVVTSFGALPEQVTHRVDGWVCPEPTAEAVAEGLEYFLSDSEVRQRAGDAARASAQRFSREQFASAWWQVFASDVPPVPPTDSATGPGAEVDGGDLSHVRVLGCFGHMVLVGGLERVAFEVIRVLRAAGAHTHIVVNGWENHRIVPFAEQLGATWSTGRYYTRLSRRERNPVKLAKMVWDILATSAGLLRDCRRFRPTHLFFPDFAAVIRNYPAVILLRLLGTRVVLKASNAPTDEPYYRRIWKYVINPVIHDCVGVSQFVVNEILACGVAGGKVHLIYNTAPMRPNISDSIAVRDPNKVIYVGQINAEKGVDLLLEAVAELARRGRDVHLDVVGDLDAWEPPNYRGFHDRLRRRAGQADLRERVHFLGFREDVPSHMKAAAVHCCPSRPELREALGIVNLEAKLAGTPSVVSRTGALPEVITHGVDGWVCDELTPRAVADGIEYLLDPAVRERAGAAALASAARYSREEFARQWRQIFGGREPPAGT